MRRLIALLTCCLVSGSCLRSRSENAVASDDELAPTLEGRLRDVRILFWGDVMHQARGSLDTLRQALPRLHALGFRRLYVELGEDRAEAFQGLLANPASSRDELDFISPSMQGAWLDLVADLRRLGGWRIMPVDFKARDGFSGRLKRIFREELGDLTWCDVPIGALDDAARDRVLDDANFTTISRTLGDTLSFAAFPDVWNDDIKTIIFFGAGHGEKVPLPGSRYKGSEVGPMAMHLSRRYGERFASVFPVPQGPVEQEAWSAFFGRLDLSRPGLIPARGVTVQASLAYDQLNNSHRHFLDEACRARFLDPGVTFGDRFDYLYVE